MIEPIYIYRPVGFHGSMVLYDYALSLGITEPTLNMHVTLAYSRDPVDWDHNTFQMDPRPLTISGGDRALTQFDGGAVVLELESRALSQRWAQFVMAGASWDYPDFRPHITLGYEEGITTEGRKLIMSEIPFGPEIREILDTGFEPAVA